LGKTENASHGTWVEWCFPFTPTQGISSRRHLNHSCAHYEACCFITLPNIGNQIFIAKDSIAGLVAHRRAVCRIAGLVKIEVHSYPFGALLLFF
jgi:hypothetical protein